MRRGWEPWLMFVLALFGCAGVRAQSPDHMTMPMAAAPDGWHFMQDGILFTEWNHQGGSRGGDQFVAPNWWMGMASREGARGRLTFSGMLSLDPATVGRRGYRELFQTGESLDGAPLVDRQHPHDLFMQLSATWRMPLGDSAGLTLSGGPVGEPAIGPVAFMHRASAADNPLAPLGHHVFDSTHVAFGVITAAIDRGPVVIEGSIFNGREPDDHRWDFDFGALDSFSGRVWYRPAPEWEIQISSARLKDPEALEPGNVIRSTASAQWTAHHGEDLTSVTVGYGRNASEHGTRRNALLVEGATIRHGTTIFSRLEWLQVETSVLLSRGVQSGVTQDPLVAFTAGATHDVLTAHGVTGAVGADLGVYVVPAALARAYSRPMSVQVFFRLRPPAGAMGRMWNMRMAQPPSASGGSMGMD